MTWTELNRRKQPAAREGASAKLMAMLRRGHVGNMMFKLIYFAEANASSDGQALKKNVD